MDPSTPQAIRSRRKTKTNGRIHSTRLPRSLCCCPRGEQCCGFVKQLKSLLGDVAAVSTRKRGSMGADGRTLLPDERRKRPPESCLAGRILTPPGRSIVERSRTWSSLCRLKSGGISPLMGGNFCAASMAQFSVATRKNRAGFCYDICRARGQRARNTAAGSQDAKSIEEQVRQRPGAIRRSEVRKIKRHNIKQHYINTLLHINFLRNQTMDSLE